MKDVYGTNNPTEDDLCREYYEAIPEASSKADPYNQEQVEQTSTYVVIDYY